MRPLAVSDLDGRVVDGIAQLVIEFRIGPDDAPPDIRKHRSPIHQGFLRHDVGLEVLRRRLHQGQCPLLASSALRSLFKLLERGFFAWFWPLHWVLSGRRVTSGSISQYQWNLASSQAQIDG